MTKWFFIILILFAPISSAQSQVQFSGSVDVAVKMGGEHSGYFINGIQSEFTHVHTRLEEFNLNFFAPIGSDFFVEGRLRVKNSPQGKLDPPKLELANITYSPLNKNYFLQGGKIIIPFGFYPWRQLQIDRTFVDYPMAYSYSLLISRERGWWKGIRGSYAANESDYGVQTIFYGAYTTGLMYGLETGQSTIRMALTNESVTGYDASTSTTLGGIARYTYTPSSYFTMGMSASYGSFMHSTTANDSVFTEAELSQFRQLALGTDFQFGITFFEIIAEATYSNWQVPGITKSSSINGDDSFSWIRNQSGEIEVLGLSNLATNIDIKYEPPSFTGSYLALRVDQMSFFEPSSNQLTDNKWDYNNTRLTAVFGYKMDRNILLKISLSEQDDFNGKAYAFKAYLTAAF